MRTTIARTRTAISSVLMAAVLTVGAAACSDDEIVAPTPVATNITITTGSDAQNGTIGQPLLTPVGVHVTNQSGASMANVTVTWSVMSGGGALANTTTTTDANGNATVQWTLGTSVGANTLKASISDSKFVTLSATGVATSATILTLVSGNAQVLAGGGTSAPLVVKAVNGSGTALAGVIVTWSTTGGTLSKLSSVTGTDGTTSATLNVAAASGARTVTATAGSVSSTFTVTGN